MRGGPVREGKEGVGARLNIAPPRPIPRIIPAPSGACLKGVSKKEVMYGECRPPPPKTGQLTLLPHRPNPHPERHMYTYTHTQTHTHTQTPQTYAPTYSYTHKRTHLHTETHILIPRHRQTHRHIRTSTDTITPSHTDTRRGVHTY